LRVGVAIPCHISDIPILKYCLASIKELNPQPHKVSIDINEGEKSLKQIRTSLFDSLFETCDVVLSVDADFYLFPNILSKVRNDKVVSFMCFYRKHYVFSLTCMRILFFNGWTGLYSIPKKIWFETVRDNFNGTDSSVNRSLGKFNWIFEKGFSYEDLRCYRESSCRQLLKNFPLWKKIYWQMTHLTVVKT